MAKKVWLFAILFIFGLTVCAGMPSDAAGPVLPNDINIIPPSSDLPKDIAAFSGKWIGTMFGQGDQVSYDIILVVEEIHNTWAQVIFSHGNTPISSPGYFRRKSKVTSFPKPRIVVEFEKIPQVIFEIKNSNTLEGSRYWGRRGGEGRGTLKRSN